MDRQRQIRRVLVDSCFHDETLFPEGDILINNQKIDIETIKPIIGFVPQEKSHHKLDSSLALENQESCWNSQNTSTMLYRCL